MATLSLSVVSVLAMKSSEGIRSSKTSGHDTRLPGAPGFTQVQLPENLCPSRCVSGDLPYGGWPLDFNAAGVNIESLIVLKSKVYGLKWTPVFGPAVKVDRGSLELRHGEWVSWQFPESFVRP
jgi:hypothetical protein